MRKVSTLFGALCLVTSMFAQAPELMSYQSVIRNSSNQLVVNKQVGMRISILQGSETGTAVYTETQTPTTNANGLVSIQIGSNTGFSSINWASGTYYIKTETDPAGATNYTISGTSQLLSVPYALYATLAKNGFSGNYNDLTNKPNLSDTAKYLELEKDPIYNVSVAKGIKSTDTAKWNAKSNFSGNYNDLTNKPLMRASKTGDTLYFGIGQYLIVPGISAANFQLKDISGNSYKIVVIGTQTWMAQDLKTNKYNDGTAIPLVTGNSAWSSLTTGGYCWNNNDSATFANPYGALYNWYAVNSGKLCPTGWHVPSNTEWATLMTYLGGESISGGKLKETGTTHWNSPNTSADNSSGFTALPSGYRQNTGTFYTVGQFADWWTSTEYSATDGYYRNVWYNDIVEITGHFPKATGFSVRCLKDN